MSCNFGLFLVALDRVQLIACRYRSAGRTERRC